jgi:hypothetical protein
LTRPELDFASLPERQEYVGLDDRELVGVPMSFEDWKLELARRAVRKAAVVAAAPGARLTIGRRSFDSPFGPLRYFVHSYNETWRYERCIEVPVARAFIAAHPGRGLEVGNVLAHYGRVDHRIVDKYERGRGVENLDVLAIHESDLSYVVSISTLEHVGWDEPERDPGKALRAVAHLRSMLAPHGRAFLSMLLGHHPEITRAVLAGDLPVEDQAFYRCRSGLWERISGDQAAAEFDPDHHELVWFGILPPG